METVSELVQIIILALLVNNFVLTKFLGLCPYLGVSKDMHSAVGMSAAVIFVMTLASVMTWTVNTFVLIPLHIEYLQTIIFILVIASLVQFVEMFIRKKSPHLYASLGIFLPLITTNCAVLGVTLLNITAFSGQSYSFAKSVVQGFGSGLGFMLALILMAGIRSRLQTARVPAALQGAPITFICAGLMAMAFMGFQGLLQ